ncbi:Wall-associated receptor kinase 5 [Hordeum vulgare]|nr:Wall-associated receptor kinase 5 [Hordeum vulgare]
MLVRGKVRCSPHGHRPPKLFLGDSTVEVLEICIPTDTVRVNSSSIALSPAVGAPGKKANGVAKYHTWSGFRRGGQFFVSPEKNKFLVLSCSNVHVLLVEDSITVNACATYCPPAQERANLLSSP